MLLLIFNLALFLYVGFDETHEPIRNGLWELKDIADFSLTVWKANTEENTEFDGISINKNYCTSKWVLAFVSFKQELRDENSVIIKMELIQTFSSLNQSNAKLELIKPNSI